MFDLLFCLLGIGLGIVLGVIPGMHINNFLPFFAALSLTGNQFFLFVIALSMAYVFSSLFPSILLGVPNEETALTILPGHRLVIEGNAYSALSISLISGVLALAMTVPFLFFFLKTLPVVYPLVQTIIPYLLIAVLLAMLLSEKKSAVIVIALSSVLGLLTVDFNLLLPLLSGFFGLSTIIISLLDQSPVPPQVMRLNSRLTLPRISMISFMSCFLSSIFGFIPAISSSIVGTIASRIREFDSEEFLAMLSGTNVAYMVYSFFALALLHKTRSGSAVFLSQIMGNESVFLMLAIALFAGFLSFSICLAIIGPLVRLYKRIDYARLSVASIVLILSLNLALAGAFGMLVLLASTSIGILANSLGVKRINCMAALIVPTITLLI